MSRTIEFPKSLSIDDIIAGLRQYAPASELAIVLRAFEVANKAHHGQLRKSGEPYITHPLAAAYLLTTMRINASIVAAALLHDVPEDTSVTIEEIERNFGPDIAGMIRGITKLGKLKYRGAQRYIENLRKMFVAMAEDVRVMIIKFADRIHNLSTLGELEEKKRNRIALESIEIYAPIAHRLGMGEFKALLEDLAFPFAYPKEYDRTKKIRDKIFGEGETYIERVLDELRKELNAADVKFIDAYGRKKQLYSFYQKLIKKNWETEKIYDIVALRIIVEDVADCYATLGVIHKLWRPAKGRIKDYIAQPKPNGYSSLHTTVFGVDGKMIEFQIRTRQMSYEAEFGVAAHWLYDEKGVQLPSKDVVWAKQLAEIQKEILHNMADLETLKVDFFRNRIFTFTPKGDVIDLPEEATPVDFAYAVHSDIGNHCAGARVNDNMVSLDTPLLSGDIVEIIVDKKRKNPSADWLKTVKTHQARSQIKNKVGSNKINMFVSMILPKKKG
ncbi:MAG: RelA/SpoT family protein [Patescibacteria group bacterium]